MTHTKDNTDHAHAYKEAGLLVRCECGDEEVVASPYADQDILDAVELAAEPSETEQRTANALGLIALTSVASLYAVAPDRDPAVVAFMEKVGTAIGKIADQIIDPPA